MKKKLLVISMVLVLAASLTACGGGGGESGGEEGGAEYTMTYAHAYSPDSIHQEVSLKFEELLEEYSGGKIDVVIYPAAQLMPMDEEYTALAENRIQASFSINSNAENFDPSYGVFNLPFIFGDVEEYLGVYKAFTETEAWQTEIVDKFSAKGVRVYPGVTDVGSAFNTAEKKIESIDQMKGMKIRISGGVYQEATGKEMGFASMTVSGSELPTALMQGTVDGAIACPVYANDTVMPISYSYFMPLSYTATCALAISDSYYASLPEDLQAAIDKAAEGMFDYSLELVSGRYQTVIDDLKANDVETTIPTDEDYWAAYDKCQPVWDLFRQNVDNGDAIIKAVQETYETYTQENGAQRERP